MNRRIRKYIISTVILATALLGCKEGTSKSNVEKAIADVTNNFPQLPKGNLSQTDFYRLVRTVSIGEKRIHLQLRATPDSINDQQQIIILINPIGEAYAIPFFSNTYRDYWGFEFETPIQSVERTGSTFKKEFITALDNLRLNDTLGTGRQIFYEMLQSLLQIEKVSENDSSLFEVIFITGKKYDYNLPVETIDSCLARKSRNLKAIMKSIHPAEHYYNYNAYWDAENKRIYQITNQGKNRWGKFELEMKTYRQDCIIHPIDL
ncbi:hypothetical protein [Pontibacter sp. SGAir0037]|uniref:hypothetical protein n=1 Tax=Pontibacter sp. SGAir0037 TaxID=2571030 RepID=UPI0010CD5F92|nr:hypothetical protein [Pontibacter sp. SGAir0037]QCR21912.1 hypothetical protein C1N53_05880 [Pontibacter sp. SGAir0037]